MDLFLFKAQHDLFFLLHNGVHELFLLGELLGYVFLNLAFRRFQCFLNDRIDGRDILYRLIGAQEHFFDLLEIIVFQHDPVGFLRSKSIFQYSFPFF